MSNLLPMLAGGGPLRFFATTPGPAAGTANASAFEAGINFQVQASGYYLQGYYIWCANSGQDTSATFGFALWETFGSESSLLVANSYTSLSNLTRGAWNFAPLSPNLPLSPNVVSYMAVYGYTTAVGFPLTSNQFGAGNTYPSGITVGPLVAPLTGAQTNSFPQESFGTATSDPRVAIPSTGFNNGNFWIDVQVGLAIPVGATFRLFPSQPFPVNNVLDAPPNNWTLATEFTTSRQTTVQRVWFYSPASATALPTQVGIFNVATQSLVAGSLNTSPTWSGALDSGWVSVTYGSLVLPAGDYKVAVFNPATSGVGWNATTVNYFSSGNPGGNGITTGPLSAPNNANATSPGQGTFTSNAAGLSYPLTAASASCYWVDVEVQ